jgi:hypothetical protein
VYHSLPLLSATQKSLTKKADNEIKLKRKKCYWEGRADKLSGQLPAKAQTGDRSDFPF